jgi:hypothetical protein
MFMELALNLVWMALAVLMFWLWMRHDSPERVSRRTQFIALAAVLLILLPVISVTDDLMAAQNPAETDSCQRKDHVCSNARPTPFAVVDLTLPVLAELSIGALSIYMPDDSFAGRTKFPTITAIRNRPPPIA